MCMKKLLIVSEDRSLDSKIHSLLKNNYSVSFISEINEAIKKIDVNEFDGYVIDPEYNTSGIEFVKQAKTKKSSLKFFAIDNHINLQQKIDILTAGVNDILSVDMHTEEILLRLKNHLDVKEYGRKKYKDIKIDLSNLSAYCNNEKLDLTLIEFKILLFLSNRPGEIITRDQLKNFTWPDSQVQDKTINTHLTNLRLKISKSVVRIKSIKGEGIILV